MKRPVMGPCKYSWPSWFRFITSAWKRGKIAKLIPYICVTESYLNQNNQYQVYRSERRYRSHGGVVTWVKSAMALTKEHKFSNGVCDTLSLYIPSLSLVLVNFYRPPDTIFEEFKEALEDVRKFIEDLERDKDISTPTITLTGDLNLPFMSDWSEAALESFLGKVQFQEREGKKRC